ncbi:MAG: LolA family protein [Candidatus Sericytochromatia bacterium]
MKSRVLTLMTLAMVGLAAPSPWLSAGHAAAAATPQTTLNQLMQRISSQGAFEAEALKLETHLKTGEATRVRLKIQGRKPHEVRMQILEHPNKQVQGFTLYYLGGASQLRIQAGGALKFLKQNFSMTHPDIVTANGYRLDQVDLYGILNRLRQKPYTVTQPKPGVLRLTPKGPHSLDARIAYEELLFDPQTLNLKGWTATTAQGKTFYQLQVNSLKLLASLPQSALKL